MNLYKSLLSHNLSHAKYQVNLHCYSSTRNLNLRTFSDLLLGLK